MCEMLAILGLGYASECNALNKECKRNTIRTEREKHCEMSWPSSVIVTCNFITTSSQMVKLFLFFFIPITFACRDAVLIEYK